MIPDSSSIFVSVPVADYYDHVELYRFMPESMFDGLQRSFLSGDPLAVVSSEDLAVLRSGVAEQEALRLACSR